MLRLKKVCIRRHSSLHWIIKKQILQNYFFKKPQLHKNKYIVFLLISFCCSVAQSRLTLCNSTDCSTPDLPVPHYLLKSAQVHLHCTGDAIHPSHPLSPPSPPAFSLSQHQGLFRWVSSLHQLVKVLEFQLQHLLFQWKFRVDFLSDWPAWSPCCPRDCEEPSPAPQSRSINALALSLLYGPALMSARDYWETTALADGPLSAKWHLSSYCAV